jgi:hypothetical protein
MNDVLFSATMAVYDGGPPHVEAVRAIFTTMSLLTHHGHRVKEVVIADNSPRPVDCLVNLAKSVPDVRYVHCPEPGGTSAPRNRGVAECRGEFFCCLDCHVLVYPRAFDTLAAFYRRRGRACPDLLHGPIMTETGAVYGHHMNDQWRAEMLGTWGLAWLTKDRVLFTCVKPEGREEVEYRNLPQDGSEQRALTPSEVKVYGLPHPLGWSRHETALYAAGCTHPASGEFCVPGHGMGFFAGRKDSWLPFHQDARGFGGEEVTTGYRYRKAGRRNAGAWSGPSGGTISTGRRPCPTLGAWGRPRTPTAPGTRFATTSWSSSGWAWTRRRSGSTSAARCRRRSGGNSWPAWTGRPTRSPAGPCPGGEP